MVVLSVVAFTTERFVRASHREKETAVFFKRPNGDAKSLFVFIEKESVSGHCGIYRSSCVAVRTSTREMC